VSDPPPTRSDPAPTRSGTLDEVLGFEPLEVGPEYARARFAVAERHKQPHGVVHGGVYAAFAESLASIATAQAVAADDEIAMGLANQTSFMRPVTDGHVHAEARRRHKGRTTWVWDVEMTDDEGRLCSLSRMTIAVRPARR
jgi:1,4-dihydroxy-2-naphthoyl-CoA hydrolase